MYFPILQKSSRVNGDEENLQLITSLDDLSLARCSNSNCKMKRITVWDKN